MAPATLEIVELNADDPAAVDAAYRIGNDTTQADLPDLPPNCRYEHEARLRHPWPASERHSFLALRGDEPVGLLGLELPTHDNLDKAHIEVAVPVEHRRQGIGRALYTHAAALAVAKGRTSALAFSPNAPGPQGFAAAFGLRNGLTDARRRLLLDSVDEAELDRLHTEGLAKATGYSVVQWCNMPPDEYLADLAALDSSFIAETPMGELDYEPENIDPERLRRQDETRAHYGSRRYQAAMVHNATGRLVAWSVLRVAKTVDWHSWQLITLVHPAHRGHRLGMVAKVENLRYLRANEPAVTTVDTFNAVENSYMIAINEAMGFRMVDLWSNWQGPLTP
jgi:GNAT superfamily N-acetyltransferase